MARVWGIGVTASGLEGFKTSWVWVLRGFGPGDSGRGHSGPRGANKRVGIWGGGGGGGVEGLQVRYSGFNMRLRGD